MSSVLAIISKSMFDQVTKGKAARPGGVLGSDRYTSNDPWLEALKSGGSKYPVTVRPPQEYRWLVAILESPEFAGGVWKSAPSPVAITDITLLQS